MAYKKKPRCLHCNKVLDKDFSKSTGRPVSANYCDAKCVSADQSLNGGYRAGNIKVPKTERDRRRKLHKRALKGDKEAWRILREEYGQTFVWDRKNQREVSILDY